MNITCGKCNHKQQFDVEVFDYQGYVCPNCHSYFKGDSIENFQFVKQFEIPKLKQWPKIAEPIPADSNRFTIITKIQRCDASGELSNEYVGLAKNDDELYISDGSDFACRLKPVSPHDIDIKNRRAKYKGGSYDLVYEARQKVVYAEGFVFEDLDQVSTALTYEHRLDEDKFISHETYGYKVECYEGVYVDNSTYFPLFSDYNTYKATVNAASRKFNNLMIFCIISIGILFYLLNMGQFGTTLFKFDENFQGNAATNQFVGKTFVLDGKVAKKMILESISEVDKADVSLSLSLVNEKTNTIQSTVNFNHFFNDVNHASAIHVDFCKVDPGDYHIVFETNMRPDSTQTIKLGEDYKITYGGVSFTPLTFFCIVLLVVFLYVKSKFTEKNIAYFSQKEVFSYFDLLKFKKFGLMYIGIILCMVFFIHYQQNVKNCDTTMKVNSLEDNTYTGSRSHYFRRTYTDYGSSHK